MLPLLSLLNLALKWLLLLRGVLTLSPLLGRHIGVSLAVEAAVFGLAAVPGIVSRAAACLLLGHVLDRVTLLVPSPALRRHVRRVAAHRGHVVGRVAAAHISGRPHIGRVVLGRVVGVAALHVLLVLPGTPVHRGRSLLAAPSHIWVWRHALVVLRRHHVRVSAHLVRRRRVALVLLLVGVGLSIASSLLLRWLLTVCWGSSIILLVVVHFIKMREILSYTKI